MSKDSVDCFVNHGSEQTKTETVISIVEWHPHSPIFHSALHMVGVRLMSYVCELSLRLQKTFWNLQVMTQMCSFKKLVSLINLAG